MQMIYSKSKKEIEVALNSPPYLIFPSFSGFELCY